MKLLIPFISSGIAGSLLTMAWLLYVTRDAFLTDPSWFGTYTVACMTLCPIAGIVAAFVFLFLYLVATSLKSAGDGIVNFCNRMYF